MLEPHRHDYYEIIWFTKGGGSHFVEFAAYEIRRDTLFFIGKNQIHAYDSQPDIQGHLLRFDEKALRLGPNDGIISLEFSLYKSSIIPYRYLMPDQVEKFSVILDQIRNEIKPPGRHHHEELLALYLKAFLMEAERLTPSERDSQTERLDLINIFHSFILMLEKHYKEHYKVIDYADQLCLSPKNLTEICRKVSDMPAKKIIDERLILEAKRFLLHSSLSVKEICYSLGFDDPAHFSKFFKNATGKSPSAFRHKSSGKYK